MKLGEKSVVQTNEKDIETIFKIVNKSPKYNSKQEQQRKQDEIRADLHRVYKKYT